MKSIHEIVSAKEIAAYYTEKMSNKIPYLGEVLFPRSKTLGLDLSWIKGAGGLPVVLKPSAFDVNVTLRDRVGLSKIETEMPFFKEGILVREKDRQELNKLLGSGNTQYLDLILSKIFDDATTLVDGAVAQEERLRMQLLTSGRIAVTANGVDLDYDYKMSGDHKGQVVASWSQHDTANPIVDIQKAQLKIATDTGTKPNRLIMNSVTFNNLMMNKAIKKDMNVLSGEHIILTEEMVKQYMKSKLQAVIQIYDKMFKDETGADKKYIPDSTVAIIPEGTLGKTMFGTTPEESDLMSGTDADVSIVNTGMAITTTKKTDPVNVETKVSMITLPSFERMDELFILDTEL